MKRRILKTSDGSQTFLVEGWDETYHSRHGAVQESYHVFIKSGLEHWLSLNSNASTIHILEMGLGTGLNAFITLLETENRGLKVRYTGIEAYPLAKEEYEALRYPEAMNAKKHVEVFRRIHQSAWGKSTSLSPVFELHKRKERFEDFTDTPQYHLVYFDAFGARAQPELWQQELFSPIYEALLPGGVWVTYAAKGSVRRSLQSVGFKVERLPGPPGKREMLRATKPL